MLYLSACTLYKPRLSTNAWSAQWNPLLNMEGPNAETFLGPCFAILCIVFMWVFVYTYKLGALTTLHSRQAVRSLRCSGILLLHNLPGSSCSQSCCVYPLVSLHGNDGGSTCTLMFYVSVLETIHVVTSIHVLYTYLVIDFADASKLLNVVWSVLLTSYMPLHLLIL